MELAIPLVSPLVWLETEAEECSAQEKKKENQTYIISLKIKRGNNKKLLSFFLL